MKIAVALIFSLGLTASAQQGIYNGAMNAAHRAVSKTEAASSQNPDGQPQTAQQAPAAQPMDPVLAATLQNIANLKADLENLGTNSEPSPAFTNDLLAASTGNKASADTVTKLATDLQAAIAGKIAFKASIPKLAANLHALSNGAHLTPAQFQMISDGIEQILEDGNASYGATTSVLADIKKLMQETK
jgi:hypothetical protein